MTSPFRSIYDHEKEHQLMLKNRGGDGLINSFYSISKFDESGGSLTNPGPTWVDGKLFKDMLSTGDSFTYSKQIGIVTKTTSNPFCLYCIGVSGATI